MRLNGASANDRFCIALTDLTFSTEATEIDAGNRLRVPVVRFSIRNH
jgi:hypothetical protein